MLVCCAAGTWVGVDAELEVLFLDRFVAGGGGDVMAVVLAVALLPDDVLRDGGPLRGGPPAAAGSLSFLSS